MFSSNIDTKAAALAILECLDKFKVDRELKLNESADKMINNIVNNQELYANSQSKEIDAAEVRGYGQNKNTGD